MPGNVTSNQSPLIKAQVFSEFLLEQLQGDYLPDGLHRDVSDFGDGDTIFIPTIGETVIRDYQEDEAVQYDPIDSGQVSLVINQYKSGATHVSRKLQQDAYMAAALEAQIPAQHLRKIRDSYESDLLAQANRQTAGDPNEVNGFSHRWVASGTNQTLDLEDFLYAKLAADKVHIPEEGRIAIVDPIVEASLNNQVAAQAFTNNPQFEGLVGTGFAQGRRFLRNIYGWDIWVSHRLPRIASETITGGPDNAERTVTDGVTNVFMSILDDQTKPFMGAWRQMPTTDGEFNKDRQRDEYVTTARWGFGLQREESLFTVLADANVYK